MKNNAKLNMSIPPYLKAGDHVGIVCTARSLSIEKLEFALDTLKSWDLFPVIGKTIGLVDHQFAGSDQDRIQDFQEMMDNPKIKAIFCAKGGYGTVRILDDLDFSRFKKNPKWVIGFSDITALHSHLHKIFKLATLHAPMPSTYKSSSDFSVRGVQDRLFGKSIHYTAAPHKFNRLGECKGALVGGNLSVLYSLIGSTSAIDTDGKILFIEDLDEYLYHIDRMVVNLKRAGLLDKLKGLVVGGMTDMKDNDTPFGQNAEEIVRNHTQEYDYPISFGFPAGHHEENWPLILGISYNLNITEEGATLIQEIE